MTDLLKEALKAVCTMPPEVQDSIARVMLLLTKDAETPAMLSTEEHNAIAASKTAASRGEFATDAEVEAVWVKYEG